MWTSTTQHGQIGSRIIKYEKIITKLILKRHSISDRYAPAGIADVHLLVKIIPKVSISEFMGAIKGRTAIRVFKQFPYLRERPYWGNHFWAEGYCVDTGGLDAEMIRKYIVFQEKKERETEKK